MQVATEAKPNPTWADIDQRISYLRDCITALAARNAELSQAIQDLIPHIDAPEVRERALKTLLENSGG